MTGRAPGTVETIRYSLRPLRCTQSVSRSCASLIYFFSLINFPCSTQIQLLSGKNNVHCGWPSTVVKECTHRFSDSSITISGSLPSIATSTTSCPLSLFIPFPIFCSPLQLPNRTERNPSTRQLHSIITVTSPLSETVFRSGYDWRRSLPNSRNSAEP
jgi:hypothetical protein